MQPWNTFQPYFYLFALDIDLVSSSDVMNVSCHHIAEEQINIQNTKHIIKMEQMTLKLVKYTTQLVY